MLSLLLHGNIDMAPRRNPFLPPSWQRCDVATTAALQAAAVRRMCDTVLLPPSPPARAQCPIDDMDQLTCARLSSLRFAAETLPAGSACATSVQNLIAALLQVEAMMQICSSPICPPAILPPDRAMNLTNFTTIKVDLPDASENPPRAAGVQASKLGTQVRGNIIGHERAH